jgi:hypothetical protein
VTISRYFYLSTYRSKNAVREVTSIDIFNRPRPTVSKSIYVAECWLQRAQLKEKMDYLKSIGYHVTSEWPNFEDKLDNPDDYAECSNIDTVGVITADTVLAFLTDDKYPYIGLLLRSVVVSDRVVESSSSVAVL